MTLARSACTRECSTAIWRGELTEYTPPSVEGQHVEEKEEGMVVVCEGEKEDEGKKEVAAVAEEEMVDKRWCRSAFMVAPERCGAERRVWSCLWFGDHHHHHHHHHHH